MEHLLSLQCILNTVISTIIYFFKYEYVMEHDTYDSEKMVKNLLVIGVSKAFQNINKKQKQKMKAPKTSKAN